MNLRYETVEERLSKHTETDLLAEWRTRQATRVLYKKFGGKNKVRWLVVLLVMIVAALTLLIVLESLGASSIFTRMTSSADAAITGAGGLVVTGLGIKSLLVK